MAGSSGSDQAAVSREFLYSGVENGYLSLFFAGLRHANLVPSPQDRSVADGWL